MSINRGMDKQDVVNIYNGILLCHSKEGNNAICSNMDGPREYHTEWSKSDGEVGLSYDISYMWNLKRNDTSELTKQVETYRLRKWNYDRQGKGIVREFGKVLYTQLYSKWITNKALLYRMFYSMLIWLSGWERRLGAIGYMHMHGWLLSLFTWNHYRIVNWLYPNTKLKV